MIIDAFINLLLLRGRSMTTFDGHMDDCATPLFTVERVVLEVACHACGEWFTWDRESLGRHAHAYVVMGAEHGLVTAWNDAEEAAS